MERYIAETHNQFKNIVHEGEEVQFERLLVEFDLLEKQYDEIDDRYNPFGENGFMEQLSKEEWHKHLVGGVYRLLIALLNKGISILELNILMILLQQ